MAQLLLINIIFIILIVQKRKFIKLRLIKKPSISYQEDPVRMLRALRFESKLGLKLTDECKQPITEMAHMINNVSPFRLFDEILKIMHSGSAVDGYKKLKEYNLFKYLPKLIISSIEDS